MSFDDPPNRSRRAASAFGSFLFFWIAPATVAGGVPWWIPGGRRRAAWPGVDAARWLGGALIVAGAITIVACCTRFALEGLGTPAPIAPTRYLVVTGLYRHVRNPMYLGVVSAIVG